MKKKHYTQLILVLFLSNILMACSPAYRVSRIGHSKMTPQKWEKFLKANSGDYESIIIKYTEASELPYVDEEAYVLQDPQFQSDHIQGKVALSLKYIEADFTKKRILEQRLISTKKRDRFFESMVIFVHKEIRPGDQKVSYQDIAYVETYDREPIDIDKIFTYVQYTLAGTAVVLGVTLVVIFVKFVNSFG